MRAHPWNILGCLLAMLYGLPSAWYPFGSDQGIHWYLGHALLHGQMPYVSGISGKPPLIFVVHALAEALFGNRQQSIRLLEILAMPLFGWLISRALRRPQDSPRDGDIGAAALLLAAANYTYQDYWNTAHPEFWMSMALMAALAVAVHQAVSMRRGLAVGALCMVAFLFKYPAAASAIPIAGYCGLRAMRAAASTKRARAFALVREAGWFLLGASVVFALCILPFVLTGTVREMLEVCVDMTENYASGLGFPSHWYRALFNLRAQGTLYLGLSTLFALGVVRTLRARNWDALGFAAFGLLLALAAIASVVMQKRLFTYHWLATYPFFVWLAAWGLRHALMRSGVLSVGAALVLTVAAFAYQPAFDTRKPPSYAVQAADWLAVLRGQSTPESLTMNYHRVTQADRFGDLVRASMVIRDRAQPGDALCLTCFISPIYQMTGLRCSTRHAIGSFVPLGPNSWKAEYARDLRERPPRFMVSIHTYARINRQLLREGYRQIARFGTVMVLELPRDELHHAPTRVLP